MATIKANIFANTKCPSCRKEWNNETGEIFEASLAKLLRKRSGVHDVPATLCLECWINDALGVFPARSARSLARPAIIAHNRYSIEYTRGNTMGTTVIEDVTITESILDDGRTEHRATLSDGEWIATYVDPPAPRHPGQSGFYWDSLEGFHQWIRWARKP